MIKIKQGQSKAELTRVIFFLSLLIFCAMAIFSLPRLSMPLAFSYIIFLIISPAVPLISKLGVSRLWAVIIVFAGLIFSTVYPLVKVAPLVTKEAENFQYYIPKMDRYLRTQYTNIRVEVKQRTGFEIGDKYINQAMSVVERGTKDFILNVPKLLASLLEWIFLVPLFVFFFLKDGHLFKKLVLRLIPNTFFERFYYISHQFNKQIGDYIFAKFVEATIVGVIILTGLLIMNVRFSLLLAMLAGVTNIIPYVGPFIGAIPAIVLGLAEYGPGSVVGGISILYLTANFIDIGLVFPILVSKIVDLHPILVVISVILGSQYFGIIGMIVSIPVAAAIKLIFLEIYKEIYPSRWT